MSPTFSLLAASLIVAQTGDYSLFNGSPGKTCPCQKNATSGYIQPVAATTSSPGLFRGLFRSSNEPVAVVEERPTLITRIQGLFGAKKTNDTFEPTTAAPVMQQNVEQPQPGLFRQMQRLPAGQPGNEPAAPQGPQSSAPVRVLQPVTYQAVPVNQLAPMGNAVIPASNDTGIRSTVLPPSRPNRISAELVGKVGHEADYSWITGQIRVENGVYVIHYATPEVVDAHNGSLVLTSDRDLRGFQDGDFVSVRGSVTGRSTYRVTNIDRLPR